MNIFQHLGLPADHRKEGKVVQLVKHMDEVPDKKIEYPLMCQIKKDGVFCMVVLAFGKHAAFGRTGRQLQNCEAILDQFEGYDNAGILIGELCCDKLSLEVLSGIVNPNRKSDLDVETAGTFKNHVRFHTHDYLTVGEFIAGGSDRLYSDRLAVVNTLDQYLSQHTGLYGPARVVVPLTAVKLGSLEKVEEWAKWAIDRGEEGIVLKQDLPWVAGHKGHHAMKRVRRVTYDLLCVGTEEGKGKRQGMVANLLFRWKGGKVIKADMGKSWRDGDRTLLWHASKRFGSPDDPVGEIFTVYGLMDSSKGVIRLPKVGELRHDKAEADY